MVSSGLNRQPKTAIDLLSAGGTSYIFGITGPILGGSGAALGSGPGSSPLRLI